MGFPAVLRSRRGVLIGTMVASTLLLPAAAQADTVVGTGVLNGNVTFSKPYPDCPALGNDSWTFSGGATAVVFDASNTIGYNGPVSVQASGGGVAVCDGAETGTVSASAQGSNGPVQSLSCQTPTGGPLLNGFYARGASTVHVQVSGTCTVDGLIAVPTTINVDGQFVPTAGDGVTQPITAAQFAGVISFEPTTGSASTPITCPGAGCWVG